jgi:hypothetical protein
MGQKEVTIETVQTAGGCHLKVIHVFLLAGHCKCCATGKKFLLNDGIIIRVKK